MIEIELPDGSIAEFPDGMSDDDIRKAIQRNFPPPQQGAPAPKYEEIPGDNTLVDTAKGTGTGLVRGIASLGGAIGDTKQMTGDVLAWGAGKLGLSEGAQETARTAGKWLAFPGLGANLPTTDTFITAAEKVTGPLPEPKTFSGQVAEKAASFAPATLLGPGGFWRKALMTAVPAFAAEVAGRVPGVDGSDYQPYVEAGVGLLAGLPIAAGGRGDALKAMREGADDLATTTAKRQAEYKKVDSAGIVYDRNQFQGAAMRMKRQLVDKGFDPLNSADGQVKALVRRVDELLKPKKVQNWTRVDDILKDAKSIARTSADATERMQASIVASNLEAIVKKGKVTSRTNMSRDQINDTIDNAREFSRREILGKNIEEMRRKMPGYLSGDESAGRNQFGSYLKSDDAKSLTPVEREAFSKVVRREGPLNVAHMLGSRLGNTISANAGAGVGALLGSAFGPLGTAAGAAAGGALNVGANLAFRKFMDIYTEKAIDDALKTVLAGRGAQAKAMTAAQKERLKAAIRASLLAETVSQPARESLIGNTSPQPAGLLGVPR